MEEVCDLFTKAGLKELYSINIAHIH